MSVHTGEVAKPLNSTFDFSSCSPIGKISQKGLHKTQKDASLTRNDDNRWRCIL